ncbi:MULTISPECIES: LacI family DNA-binding transcriptional regulator [unclassified Rhizobium]|uniref:LacI family DNA-binding transcriptional regulator n=1 Tax=unclassified Rhizobium TaxID=2613769 RepID=UPI001C83E6DF|nr:MULTISPECIES: LacI family DNA-binding transcriptional regulator [unclassified Rhizobium]MBX5215615.1 LacI family DNA-binding transcriptional regulator [Rhizobium sp. NLR9a]MBX5221474.1 LacI family DNA-binding transcriptional regulator [Rhizobium sp. NLR8a]MBX5226936.1 LacI family DNA-binding transcriptional regulator [Rhizobium sp. NLR9b]MBX5232778.1 LacI family DNA-binding transcriptional regulator [Rhizobium sp. NLR4a]MBX5238255.1 LacI family DNA-binding transcriptional regulator [Rhizobi
MASSRSGPNLSRIATSLGVSIATVSNALSGKGRVSGPLVERIREHAAELGYVPSQAGRALRTGRSGVLGLVLPDIANPLFPKIAQAIEYAASIAGYGVLIADSRGDAAAQTEAIDRLVERGVDGLIIVPRRATRISSAACPVALIDTPSTPGNTVSADHWQGGREIALHLADLGHQRILIIGNNQESSVQNDRADGIRAGMHAGMHAETLWIGKVEQDGGSGCPLGLAEKVREGFTAFAALSDLQALRALTELQQAGISVPGDVSVTGFDDLIWSPVVTPSLTTVRMDMDRIAGIAVSALADTIRKSRVREGVLVTAEIERVAMQLIVRQSSGPASPATKTSEMENM